MAPFPVENRYVAECAGHKFDNYVEWLAIVYAIRHTPRAQKRERQRIRLVRPTLSGPLGHLLRHRKLTLPETSLLKSGGVNKGLKGRTSLTIALRGDIELTIARVRGIDIAQ